MGKTENRYLGALVGLACGDALGTTLEFTSPNLIDKPLTEIVGGGPFYLDAGEWTDDTSMALCLGTSLIEKQDFDGVDQLERYCRWRSEGYMSSNGECFDIGYTTSTALNYFEKYNDPESGMVCNSKEEDSGNGSLMRLAPIPMAFALDPLLGIKMAGKSSVTTHGSVKCIDACKMYAGLIVAALHGESKEVILSELYRSHGLTNWNEGELDHKIEKISKGSYKLKQPPAIKGTGYVVESLEAALWAFYHSKNFKHGCLLAANLGDDADTTAAICGQLAGAYYGYKDIPTHWIDILAEWRIIEDIAKNLRECPYGI